MEGGMDHVQNHASGGKNKKKSIVVGPWGGNGGGSWDDGTYNGVREITLVYNHCILSISVVYDKSGKSVTPEKHGGVGGNSRNPMAKIKLQYPEEFLIGVSGHYSPVDYGGSSVVRSLTFKSNKRTFGPYGIKEGTPFTFSMDGGRVVGFNGKSGWYLDAIGFHLYKKQTTKLFKSSVASYLEKEGGKDHVQNHASGGKNKNSIVVGPWGGNGGSSWDDGTYNGVREITLVYDHLIYSISVVYDKNGKPVTPEKHGGGGGNRTATIKLQYPEEFLISVSGHYSPTWEGGSSMVRSLTFKSNKRTFGPYGVEDGTPFTFSMDGERVVGFNGKSGVYLDAIGFHLYKKQSTKLFKRVQRLASKTSRSPASF